ncbi:MAG: hypothetical protein IKO46_12165 [Salinivirgaceae bacterium]|nr:hypothetical protein [Salinivirgaceae bacterium]
MYQNQLFIDSAATAHPFCTAVHVQNKKTEKKHLYLEHFKTLFPNAKIKVTAKNYGFYVRLRQGRRHLRTYFYNNPERATAYFSNELALFV